jgi:hypothetical protein
LPETPHEPKEKAAEAIDTGRAKAVLDGLQKRFPNS